MSAPPFKRKAETGDIPFLNLFCNSRKATGTTHYAGFAYLQNGTDGPGEYVCDIQAQITDTPTIEPKRSRGRPKTTAENVTFLAHCEMVRRLAPDNTSESYVRNEAMRTILKDSSFYEEPPLPGPGTAMDKKRGLQQKLKKAREEISGLRQCLSICQRNQVGYWLAIETIPNATENRIEIDSLGWLCFSGEKAEYGRIKWIAPASMFRR